jgi:multimeric flavodoxin WrbA
MKIVSIIASPNGIDGYTGKLMKPLLEGVKNAGADNEVLSFKELKVNCCKACTKICHTTGECHQKDDDFNQVLEAMLEADGIVFATPNYNFNVTAQFKALIDRCSFPLHCQKFRGKYGVTVVTSGGSDPVMVEDYLNAILPMYGFRMLGGVSGVQMQFEDPEECADLNKAAALLGEKLVDAVKNQMVLDDEKEEKLQDAYDLISYLVQTQKDDWPLAYKYWQENWGIEELEM